MTLRTQAAAAQSFLGTQWIALLSLFSRVPARLAGLIAGSLGKASLTGIFLVSRRRPLKPFRLNPAGDSGDVEASSIGRFLSRTAAGF